MKQKKQTMDCWLFSADTDYICADIPRAFITGPGVQFYKMEWYGGDEICRVKELYRYISK